MMIVYIMVTIRVKKQKVECSLGTSNWPAVTLRVGTPGYPYSSALQRQ